MNNKLFIIIILILLISLPKNIFSINGKYYDSINIRKRFFLYKAWQDLIETNYGRIKSKNLNYYKESEIKIKINDEYVENVLFKFPDEKIGFIFIKYKNHSVFHFYSAEKGWNDHYSFGSVRYVFTNDKKMINVKVFLHQDEKTYIEFSRKNEGKFEIYLFGKQYKKNQKYYFSFDSLKILSLYSMLSVLENNSLNKELLINDNDKYLKNKFINKVIIPVTKNEYEEDGAKNEFGEYVFIEDEKYQETSKGLNCSGYLKEIADNYIRLCNPDHTYLKISELKIERTEDRKNSTFQYQEVTTDPFFGIDWTKNIADKINENCGYKIIKAHELKNDRYYPYDKNRGYYTSNLKEILFRDQLKDSTHFYFLVFNALPSKYIKQDIPFVPAYNHIAIAAPYFYDHNFYIRIFESNAETNYNNILKYRLNDKVIIIKVPLPLRHLDK